MGNWPQPLTVVNTENQASRQEIGDGIRFQCLAEAWWSQPTEGATHWYYFY